MMDKHAPDICWNNRQSDTDHDDMQAASPAATTLSQTGMSPMTAEHPSAGSIGTLPPSTAEPEQSDRKGESEGGLDERACRRRFAEARVTLKSMTGSTYTGTLENISEKGCMISLDGGVPIKRGRVVSFRLIESENVVGRIVWSCLNKVGIQFSSPVAADVLEEHARSFLWQRLSLANLSCEPIRELPTRAP